MICRVTIIIAHVRGLRTLLMTTHEPPSNGLQMRAWGTAGFLCKGFGFKVAWIRFRFGGSWKWRDVLVASARTQIPANI